MGRVSFVAGPCFALFVAFVTFVTFVTWPLWAQGLGIIAPPAGYKPEKRTVRVFEAKCATCHGDDGRANTELGKEMAIADMSKAAYWSNLTLESARKSVLEGVKRTSGKTQQEMKPFKDRLTPEQIDALNLYASSFKK
jgi:mono/diheme cytochrome c family protein